MGRGELVTANSVHRQVTIEAGRRALLLGAQDCSMNRGLDRNTTVRPKTSIAGLFVLKRSARNTELLEAEVVFHHLTQSRRGESLCASHAALSVNVYSFASGVGSGEEFRVRCFAKRLI